MILASQVYNKNLRELLGADSDPSVKKDYDVIIDMVRVMLFSKFPKRRELGKKRLVDFLGSMICPFMMEVNFETIQDECIVYAYVQVLKSPPTYVLIEKYHVQNHTFELGPDDEEKAIFESEL